MTAERVFEKKSLLNYSAEEVLAFHDLPNAFKILTPPPVIIQVIRDEKESLTKGDVEFNMWLGILPLRWLARHKPGPIETSFVDEMIQGPLASWRHEHLCNPKGDQCELVDRITFSHKSGVLGLFTYFAFELPLGMLFFFRHFQTKRILKKMRKRNERKKS